MGSGIRKIPEHLRMSRQDHRKAIEVSSRTNVEVEKWESHCSSYNPIIARINPQSNRMGVVHFSVQIEKDFCNCGCLSNESGERNFALLVPDNYPNALPLIYPDKWNLDYHERGHMYKDRNGKVHICVMFKDDWSRDISLAGLMPLTSKWLHKHLHWKHTGDWPGKSQPHCICGEKFSTCKCR